MSWNSAPAANDIFLRNDGKPVATVCSLNSRDSKEVYFPWGRFAYKTNLGGAPKRFDQVNVYRHRTAHLRYLDQAMLAAVIVLVQGTHRYLLNAEGQPTPQGRMADILWRCARQVTRAVNAIWRTTR